MSRDEDPQMRSRAIAALTDSGTGDEAASTRAYGVQPLAMRAGPEVMGAFMAGPAGPIRRGSDHGCRECEITGSRDRAASRGAFRCRRDRSFRSRKPVEPRATPGGHRIAGKQVKGHGSRGGQGQGQETWDTEEIDRLSKTSLVCGSLQAVHGGTGVFQIRQRLKNKRGKQKAHSCFPG